MALDRLGSSLTNAIKKLFKAGVVDEAAVKELVRDIQRALLQSDVNVQLVLDISKRIEERALKENVPPGISRREHVIKVVYEELTRFVGDKPVPLKVEPGKKKIIMLVGIQGSGKTTHAAKIARYYQKRGFKPGLIAADTFRPGAYAQLLQLGNRINLTVFGDAKAKDPVKVVREGLKVYADKDLIIVDTAGRHKEEKDLIKEMKDLEKNIKPDEVIMVIDGTIGQQALVQAKTFHEATPIGAIIVTKLDGSSRGGGALSAVAATGAPIKFIGTGEKIEDIEPFVPSRFVGRLLGMGDLETLLEKVHDAEVKVPQKKTKEILSGKFTLTDMYEQFSAVKNMGPFSKVLKMLPGMSYNVPDEMLNNAEGRLDMWRVIIQSMTPEEKENPKILNSSRARRIARGSGTTEKDVKELLKQYLMMRKMLKMFKRKKKLPFGLGGKGGMMGGIPPNFK
ncbi:MAG: signal recognition particle protein Srp54 [Nitrososphaerota archaeon]|jgi:signal recognition particle subunit SRP54|uniref:signal recognition particle protein Srp54 n=1 Tax=Candidatus Bathycorpusculum sp. TaxID=2994959 RepID=UPI002828048D|nr:signal recognition particle protein Srp54 [Candidatus Termiticorpusculum sp.]MCL2256680.1 signal recognition particle protein Srp54 [Candidatus Termiticorpusculum sp.]MCL2293112.1 signal recognition particle protein Srp54 [Candidatus Termiticorpusculum sp.]MDR0461288.1 signal recognition particle protein Srp54 [Nitrososphaerota archaeon]